jgi:NAD+ diphosphatase
MRNTSSLSPVRAYKFCPKCGAKTEHKGGNLLKCTQCQYNYFINAAPAVGVFIVNQDGQVLLAKRKFAPMAGTWQTPGGFMHPGETAEEAIRREVLEELGVEIQIVGYAGSMPETYEYGGVDLPFLGIYYTATITKGVVSPRDDVAEVRYCDLDDIADLDITYPGLLPLLRQLLGDAD